ncbi:ferritin-like domain-containing protein [Blastopirellula sp. JC732]|uniref:Ferritin-like domain-containing protein n=1 Tax=Blastopirellula sediminis TaxID=2894196 RepID=A0A9X1MPC9_9BACT|nr:ferritin-like domain-containing protein [Blastopirellula sediminis]MCC9606793.1 ferritin-like domain-containing protein [Blastopirellula sediminis]MCC9629910.1 ferritin-like domain-containing protein [Blastopirellula sediminis]
MATHSLADAFLEELQDVLSAETQLVKALPQMVEKASDHALKQVFESHLYETQTHVERLEEVFESIGQPPKAKKCEAMAGLIREAGGIMRLDAEQEVMDALLIAAAQKIEHYEIATYGTLCTWAELLNFVDGLQLLKQNMEDEEAADDKLTQIALTVNQAAKMGR